jgi:hypothetical protein
MVSSLYQEKISKSLFYRPVPIMPHIYFVFTCSSMKIRRKSAY